MKGCDFMESNRSTCEKLHHITRIPMVLTDNNGTVCGIWPDLPLDYLHVDALQCVIADFRLQRRDPLHPLISYVDPGYFLGVCELPGKKYAVIGLVSPIPHSHKEILSMCQNIVSPKCLQQFLDLMVKTPLFSLGQIRDMICILVQLTFGQCIPPEHVQLNDLFLNNADHPLDLSPELFSQRENAEFHVPIDFETALCHAVENGSREDLMKILYTPVRGRVGKMSLDELRQQKYAAVCLATLLSRAAIRAGLTEEVSFAISDFSCQHIDQMHDIAQIQRCVLTMMTEFCDRVKEVKQTEKYSVVVRKTMDYISVHLHESISLDDLSKHCSLCSRSLSLRFKKETGLGIPDYIHSEKIREAKYMLSHTGYSLSEISCFLNYPSQSYFTQVFKRYTGTTPQLFRNSVRR